VHKWTAKTTTKFDDIMVRETRIATLLWCILLGIYVGWKIAYTPADWVDIETHVISSIFAAIGVYSAIVIVMGTLKWYKVEICPKTSSSLDEFIMGALIFGTPIIGGALGIIWVMNLAGYGNDDVNLWLDERLGTIGLLVILAVTLLMLTILIVPRVINTAVRNAKAEQTEEELKKRADTLTSVTVTTLQVVIIFVFALMIIPQIAPSVNITPVLTGAGVLGLAVGFGAQSLVKDVISGLFIIMENQYRKGDVIKIAGESGVVEEINLRRTILRDGDGVYHVVPNGEIRVSSNLTMQWARVNMTVSVAYDTDLDKAIAVINRVGKELSEDITWVPFITNPPRAIRVDKLGDSGIDIRIMGDTKPSKQWDVAGEMRLRLKKAFDVEGIDIPYPHTKIIFGNALPQTRPVDEASLKEASIKEAAIKIEGTPPTKKLPN
jgi:small conductance mechanosensitive channel